MADKPFTLGDFGVHGRTHVPAGLVANTPIGDGVVPVPGDSLLDPWHC